MSDRDYEAPPPTPSFDYLLERAMHYTERGLDADDLDEGLRHRCIAAGQVYATLAQAIATDKLRNQTQRIAREAAGLVDTTGEIKDRLGEIGTVLEDRLGRQAPGGVGR